MSKIWMNLINFLSFVIIVYMNTPASSKIWKRKTLSASAKPRSKFKYTHTVPATLITSTQYLLITFTNRASRKRKVSKETASTRTNICRRTLSATTDDIHPDRRTLFFLTLVGQGCCAARRLTECRSNKLCDFFVCFSVWVFSFARFARMIPFLNVPLLSRHTHYLTIFSNSQNPHSSWHSTHLAPRHLPWMPTTLLSRWRIQQKVLEIALTLNLWLGVGEILLFLLACAEIKPKDPFDWWSSAIVV